MFRKLRDEPTNEQDLRNLNDEETEQFRVSTQQNSEGDDDNTIINQLMET